LLQLDAAATTTKSHKLPHRRSAAIHQQWLLSALGLALDGRHYRDQDVMLLSSILTLTIGFLSATGGAIYYRTRIAP